MLLPKTLIRPSEVIQLTNVSDKLPPCNLQDVYSREITEFRDCIGYAFRAVLVADLVDYTGTAAYNGATAYEIDDVVVYNDIYYVCVQAVTNATPNNLEYWQLAPKFTTEAYNELFYIGFLGRYLAFAVLKQSTPFMNAQFKAQGVVQPAGEGYNSASSDSFKTLFNGVISNYTDAYNNLKQYMNENNLNGIFDLATKIIETSRCSCGNSCRKGAGCLTNKKAINSNSVWG